MFCYQKSTKSRSAAKCSREVFWNAIKDPSTKWRIDARRAIIDAVERSNGDEGPMALIPWLQNNDYQRYLVEHPQELSSDTAREAWEQKTDAEKLLAFADSLKQKLIPFVFCCYEFDKKGIYCPRQLQFCHVNGLVMHDYDHLENPLEVWYRLRDNAELMARTAFVHLTSSGHGIRIISTADINVGNLADNQIVFAEALGQIPDDSCIDATRNSFAPKEEDILYINEELLFEYYDEEFDKKYTPMYRERKTQPLYHKFPSDSGSDGAGSAKNNAMAGKDAAQGSGIVRQMDVSSSRLREAHGEISGDFSTTLEMTDWCGYDVQKIIDVRYGGDRRPSAKSRSRHKESLILATDLLLMLDGDKALVQRIVERQPWVQEIIRERDENVAQTVESAAKQMARREESTAEPYPSKAMQKAVEEVTGRKYRDAIRSVECRTESVERATAAESTSKNSCGAGANSKLSTLNSQLKSWGEEIEELFPYFPLLADVCSGLKKSQYPAAVFVAGGALMTLMTRCWYRFYHRPQQERRLNCALMIIGHPASNKSMADDLVTILLAPMVSADKAGKQALNRYKQDLKKKAANKEGKDKPQGIIRVHPARTSNGQLIQDMLNAKESIEGKEIQLHMFTFDTELDNSITLQQGGSWINKQSMELKAFHNEKDGQMYQNNDSPVDEFNVTWNFIYTGTPIALKKKVNVRNFGSGLSTRLAVIPMPKTNYEMMEFEEESTIDWQRLDRMKTWAFKLDTRFGELPFWSLVRKLYDWTKDRMADCAEDDSEANELMLKRVPYHAINYAAPFIDMRHWQDVHQQGSYWTGRYETDDIDWKLCELIARIQYATQQHFFGVMAEKYFDDMNNDVQISGKRHQQKSVDGYNRLPEVFTNEDVLKSFGYKEDGSAVYMKIRRLIDQGLIEKILEGDDKGKFKKISKFYA